MVNECVMGCASSGDKKSSASSSNSDEKPSTSCCDEKPTTGKAVRNFHFPINKNIHLLPYWEKFVNRGPDWKASKNTVLCSKHFEPHLIKENDRSATLNWTLNPIPNIYVNEIFKTHPSLLPTPVSMRKPPKKRNYQEDELATYLK